MLITVFVIFIMLLGYEIHCRKKEEEEKRKGLPNPYKNCEWFINDKRVNKSISIPTKENKFNK